MPAKWLCDVSSVLVGVWLLINLRFQPSLLASKLLAAPRKGEQSVSLSLPVHRLSTASPMQCLLAAAGVYGCRKAPEPNCKGETSMTQRWSRRRRTKVPTAAKADEVIPSYRLNSPTPTIGRSGGRGELATPNSCEGGRGKHPAAGHSSRADGARKS